eukprot:Rmarinus@m.17346
MTSSAHVIQQQPSLVDRLLASSFNFTPDFHARAESRPDPTFVQPSDVEPEVVQFISVAEGPCREDGSPFRKEDVQKTPTTGSSFLSQLLKDRNNEEGKGQHRDPVPAAPENDADEANALEEAKRRRQSRYADTHASAGPGTTAKAQTKLRVFFPPYLSTSSKEPTTRPLSLSVDTAITFEKLVLMALRQLHCLEGDEDFWMRPADYELRVADDDGDLDDDYPAFGASRLVSESGVQTFILARRPGAPVPQQSQPSAARGTTRAHTKGPGNAVTDTDTEEDAGSPRPSLLYRLFCGLFICPDKPVQTGATGATGAAGGGRTLVSHPKTAPVTQETPREASFGSSP